MNCNSRITYDKNCDLTVHETNYNQNYVYAYLLQLNKSTETITQSYIRTDSREATFQTSFDGFYTLILIKVSKSTDAECYYKDNKFYYSNVEVSLERLFKMNSDISGLEIEYEHYFLLCRLKHCYIDACRKLFNQNHSIECNKNGIDSFLSYKRDLIWAALNTIEYLVEQGDYVEAERILERIMDCNGLCKDKGPCKRCGCS